jgi:hypothetical protein
MNGEGAPAKEVAGERGGPAYTKEVVSLRTGGGRAGAPATKISGALSAYSLVLTVVVLTVVYVLQLSVTCRMTMQMCNA